MCGLREVSLVSFTYSFYLVLSNLTFWFSDFVSKGSKLLLDPKVTSLEVFNTVKLNDIESMLDL